MCAADSGDGHLPRAVSHRQQIGVVAFFHIANEISLVVVTVDMDRLPLLKQRDMDSIALQAVGKGEMMGFSPDIIGADD